eukprot:6597968-Pyramimonas_sp.AAC.1
MRPKSSTLTDSCTAGQAACTASKGPKRINCSIQVAKVHPGTIVCSTQSREPTAPPTSRMRGAR